MGYPESLGQRTLLNACFVSDPTGNGAQSGRWKRMEMVQGCGGRSPDGWCSAHVATEVSSALRSHACVCLGQFDRTWTQDPNGERILRYRRSITYPKLDCLFNTFVELSCSLPVSTFSDGVTFPGQPSQEEAPSYIRPNSLSPQNTRTMLGLSPTWPPFHRPSKPKSSLNPKE